MAHTRFWLVMAGLASLVSGFWGMSIATGIVVKLLYGLVAAGGLLLLASGVISHASFFLLALLGNVPGLLVMGGFLLAWGLGATHLYGSLGQHVLPLLLATLTVWASYQALSAGEQEAAS